MRFIHACFFLLILLPYLGCSSGGSSGGNGGSSNPDLVPPEIGAIQSETVMVDQLFALDLAIFVIDDKTPVSNLTFMVTVGDGFFSGSVYTNTWTTAGNKEIHFSVTDEDGVTSMGTFTVNVLRNHPPVAVFTVTPVQTDGQAPLDVDFDATLSSDFDGEIVSYDWDFGEGEPGSGVTTTHTYEDTGEFTVALIVTDDGGGTAMATEAVRIADYRVTSITNSSPENGEQNVAVTRQTTIQFSRPVTSDEWPSAVQAQFGGEILPAIVHISQDHLRVSLIYAVESQGIPSLPSSARVRVTIDGDLIGDDLDRPVDADGDGIPGGSANIDFDTNSLTPVPGTSVFGFVYASKKGLGGEDLPLEGVVIRVAGLDISATTDNSGLFELFDTPAPMFHVEIDGSVVRSVGGQAPPPGGFYPTLGKPFHSVPGQRTQISMNHEPFNIYLPFIPDGSLLPVLPNEPTEVELTDEGKARLGELFPAIPVEMFDELKLEVPADSLMGKDGAPGTVVGIFPVDSSRLPAPLPSSLNHSFELLQKYRIE